MTRGLEARIKDGLHFWDSGAYAAVVLAGRLKRSLRATLVGLAGNTILTTAKFTAGILGHSHALVADAVESLADILSSLIV